MKILSSTETMTVLVEAGLDRPQQKSFALRQSTDAIFYDWHAHSYHQIICARAGTTQIEGPDGRYLLPAAHALWIPARTRHRTMIRNHDGMSFFLAPDDAQTVIEAMTTFPLTPILTEMMFYALRWPDGPQSADALAQSFFNTLALLCHERIKAAPAAGLALPMPRHPRLIRAVDAALLDPASATMTRICACAAMSERSFRRHFQAETGMGWQSWMTQARLFHAALQLGQGQRVTDVAAECGYASLSAFAKAFNQRFGLTPARFRAHAMQER
ncbi:MULTISPECIES: helix-turn-helix transcriptional regulator [Asaia]|uniref:Transcriptional regulator, AraC family n=1 Tax=Asaia bogorensis TaxID=91915 RepID=A0A060QKA3_9PROT|nr:MULTISPECIES: AraC family transcriptional regulator [Asaia]ETC97665.1 AraC family transcriptional regulator [Asaia sp. SF2.1]CDG41208.1 Transcriptional regulator, AraC family [Asaia bogorensis]